MIDEVKKYVLDLCDKADIRWKYHITSVVKYSDILCSKFESNREVVILASWLHDIASLQNIAGEHHIVGAEIAEKYLQEKNLSQEMIKSVKKCILAHSDKGDYTPNTIEEKILASADGMSDFDHFDLTCHRFFIKYPMDQVREMLLDKYERAYSKIMPEARDMIQSKYDAIKVLLIE